MTLVLRSEKKCVSLQWPFGDSKEVYLDLSLARDKMNLVMCRVFELAALGLHPADRRQEECGKLINNFMGEKGEISRFNPLELNYKSNFDSKAEFLFSFAIKRLKAKRVTYVVKQGEDSEAFLSLNSERVKAFLEGVYEESLFVNLEKGDRPRFMVDMENGYVTKPYAFVTRLWKWETYKEPKGLTPPKENSMADANQVD